jgi:hypothetical protein
VLASIIRLKLANSSEINLILEVKGFEDEKARGKKTAAQRWVEAVNHHGAYGRWALAECKSPHALTALIGIACHAVPPSYTSDTRNSVPRLQNPYFLPFVGTFKDTLRKRGFWDLSAVYLKEKSELSGLRSAGGF